MYSFRDLVALRVIKALLDSGMSLQRVRRAYDYLRKRAALEEHLSSVKLVSDGRTIYGVDEDEGAILDALRDGQLAFFVTLDDVARSVDDRTAYLYDRDDFVKALRRAGGRLDRPGTRVAGRLSAAQ